MLSPREIVERWSAAYNVRDASAQAALYADDASNWQHALGEPVVGRDKIRAGLAAFYLAFPDSSIRTEALLESGTEAAWFWIARGTWTGPFAGRQPNGKTYELRGSTLIYVRDDKIAAQRAYWDRASWFKQLDIPV